MNVDARVLDHYKRLLLAKRDELSATKAEVAAPVAGAGGAHGDLIDQAAAQTETELQVRLHQTDTRLFRAIEQALVRINGGTFGVCEVCRRPIAEARLEAVPWTRVCRDCKEREHVRL